MTRDRAETQRISVVTLKKEGIRRNLPAAANAFYDPSCLSKNSQLEWMGYTVRSAAWRFTVCSRQDPLHSRCVGLSFLVR